MATPGGANEKTGPSEVQVEQSGHHHHHREFNVIPIEQEAVQDAVHVNLTWKSWVRSDDATLIVKHMFTDRSLLRLAGGFPYLLWVSTLPTGHSRLHDVRH